MIFSGVQYFVSPSFPNARQEELSRFLDANGGSGVAIEDATHIITNTLQFAGEALSKDDARVVTVRFIIASICVYNQFINIIIQDEWVSRSILHGKQQEYAYLHSSMCLL